MNSCNTSKAGGTTSAPPNRSIACALWLIGSGDACERCPPAGRLVRACARRGLGKALGRALPKRRRWPPRPQVPRSLSLPGRHLRAARPLLRRPGGYLPIPKGRFAPMAQALSSGYRVHAAVSPARPAQGLHKAAPLRLLILILLAVGFAVHPQARAVDPELSLIPVGMPQGRRDPHVC